MHDITMRRYANGSPEHPREMERTTAGYFRKRGDLNGLINVRNDIISELVEYPQAQLAPCPTCERCHVTSDQPVNEAARGLVPEERAIRIILCALRRQRPGQVKERLIVA